MQRGVFLDDRGMGPTQRALLEARKKADINKDVATIPENFKRHPKVSDFYFNFYKILIKLCSV